MTLTRDMRGIIDLHCDTISECYQKRLGLVNDALHFSLGKLPEGCALCQCMAVWMPDSLRGKDAAEYFVIVADLFKAQIDEHSEKISQVFDLTKIDEALLEKQYAAVLTIEGASALGGDLSNIERFYDMGARIMSLTWNAENELCGGCLSDAGFKPFGRKAVREMERVGIAVDTAHLNDKSFWELCEITEKPFVNTHSNSRKICGHPRNVTDDMFGELVRRKGLLGINFSKGFIRMDGLDGSVNDVLKHVHHFLEQDGENVLALGSDYDGTGVPGYLDGIGRLPYFAESLEKSGIPSSIVDNILFGNADRYLKKLYKERE